LSESTINAIDDQLTLSLLRALIILRFLWYIKGCCNSPDSENSYYINELSELTRQTNNIDYLMPDLLRTLFILIVILVRFTTIIVDSDLEKRYSNFYVLVFVCIFFSICCFNTNNLF
jgi:hypothetical protein